MEELFYRRRISNSKIFMLVVIYISYAFITYYSYKVGFLYFQGKYYTTPFSYVFWFLVLNLIISPISHIFICSYDKKNFDANLLSFHRYSPFINLGQFYYKFQYVFFSKKFLVKEALAKISQGFKDKLGTEGIEKVVLHDKDIYIKPKEDREYFTLALPETFRGSKLHILFHIYHKIDSQIIEWSYLSQGRYSKANYCYMILMSPVQCLVKLVARLLSMLTNFPRINLYRSCFKRYENHFDDEELLITIKTCQKLSIDILFDLLEENKIENDDLKQQRAQVMNLQITGGKNKFKSIIQGKGNRAIIGTTGGK